MIPMILGILKGIGILILVLLALLLLLLALVLLVSFRYTVHAKTFPAAQNFPDMQKLPLLQNLTDTQELLLTQNFPATQDHPFGQNQPATQDHPFAQNQPAEEGSEKQAVWAEARLSWLFRFFNVYLKYEEGLEIIAKVAFFKVFAMNTKEESEEDAKDEDDFIETDIHEAGSHGEQENDLESEGNPKIDTNVSPWHEVGPDPANGEKLDGVVAAKEEMPSGAGNGSGHATLDNTTMNQNGISKKDQEDIIQTLLEDERRGKSNFISRIKERLRLIRTGKSANGRKGADSGRAEASRKDADGRNAGLGEESGRKKPMIEVDVFGILDRLDACLEWLEDKYEDLLLKIEDWQSQIERFQVKLERLQAQYEDERNRNAVQVLLHFAWKSLKHIAPKSPSGKVRLGFDDPASTGKAIGMMMVFRNTFYPNVLVESDFEKKIIDADIHLKGRIRLGNILWYALQVVVKKDIWYLYKNVKKIRKEWKNGRQ